MPNPGSFPYRDHGGALHRVMAQETADGAWEVIDVSAGETVVIERLHGFEGATEATAIAREYAAHHHHPREETCRPAAGA